MVSKHSSGPPARQPGEPVGRHYARSRVRHVVMHRSTVRWPGARIPSARTSAWRAPVPGPRLLVSGLVALALLTAGTVYATVQTGPALDAASARPASAGPAASSGAESAAGGGVPPPAFNVSGTGPAAASATFPPAPTGDTALGGSTRPGPSLPAPPPPAAGPQSANPGAANPAGTDPLLRDGDVISARRAAPVSRQLESRIDTVIAAHSAYDVGVAMVDVSEGAVDDTVHEFGVPSGFVAASTGKILAAAAFYHLVETGQASLVDPLGYSTAGAQIRQMVQQSNNESWALILGVLGRQGLTDYAAGIGIDYDRSVNVLTPADMARTLALLYAGRLLNPQNTAQLLSYMKNTNYETLLPAAVPPGVGVFHKYGLLSANLHDAGILVQDGEAFVLVVYTRGRGLSDMELQAVVIREIAGTVAEALF